MTTKKTLSQATKDLDKSRKLVENHPQLIFAEDETFEVNDGIKLLKGIVRIGHLPTLKYVMIPLGSLPLTPEFLKDMCKAFATKKCDSYKLFRIINT